MKNTVFENVKFVNKDIKSDDKVATFDIHSAYMMGLHIVLKFFVFSII